MPNIIKEEGYRARGPTTHEIAKGPMCKGGKQQKNLAFNHCNKQMVFQQRQMLLSLTLEACLQQQRHFQQQLL